MTAFIHRHNDRVEAIAYVFASNLKAILTDKQLATVKKRNEKLMFTGSCATHDFCDANMPMEAAFEEVMKRGSAPDSDDDMDLWNEAWQMAKEADFEFAPWPQAEE